MVSAWRIVKQNYVVNPRHADFAKLHVGKPSHFRFDRRLTGK
jgi:hypothetical protein